MTRRLASLVAFVTLLVASDVARADLHFAFWKGGCSAPDPAAFAFTSWIRGSYPGIPPWPDTASAGTSSTWQEASVGGSSAPVSGFVLNTFAAARYDSTSFATASKTQNAGTLANADIGDMITASEYTVLGLAYVTSADPIAANAYQNSTIMQGDARWGVAFYSTGAGSGRLGPYHFTGGFPMVDAPIPLGAWFFFCVRFGGVIGAGTVEVDINTTHGAPTVLANVSTLAGVPVTTGNGTFNAAAHFVFDLEERASLKRAISDSERDGEYAAMKCRYPAAGLP